MRKRTLDFDDCMADREVVRQELSRRCHLRFMQYCWQKTSEPLLVGLHTREICRLIDNAMEDFRAGRSTFLVIKVPYRHGKSDMISRYLPPHFLGQFPDSEVMLVTYAMSLAEGFSRFARNLIRTKTYHELYPDIDVHRENGGVQQWGVQGHLGGCVASGLSSGLTGKGYHLGLLDDYCAGRAEAESEVMRNGMWEHFKDDFLTRRAPVSITIVLATPWHVDDIIGRIERKINPQSEEYDKDFPAFKVVTFPAMDGDVIVNGQEVKYKYLFPERFSAEWYEQQRASLGAYSAAALLQCNPVMRGGGLIDTSHIVIHSEERDFPKVQYCRVWDLAHTARQTMKGDPDYTSGTLLAFTKTNGVYSLWIKDVARIRAEAPERDNFIISVTEKDGAGVSIAVENSLDSKDAAARLSVALKGRRVVHSVNIRDDKITRTGYIEPIFEAGNVHILRGEWNRDWLEEVGDFPGGRHDDQVDNLTAGYYHKCINGKILVKGKVYGV